MERKKKLRIIQLSLLFLGLCIILFTYSENKNTVQKKEILPKTTKEKINKELKGENQNHPHIYFFDSVAKKPPQEVEDFIKKMINESKEINNELKFAYNNIVHQQENTECGIYSIYFISEMLKGRKFHELINKIKRDSYMKKLRKFFFIE